MQHCTAPVVFESSGEHAVLHDPVNEDWVALFAALDNERVHVLLRRYYQALDHFRKQQARPALEGQTEVKAQSRQQAFEAMLGKMEQRKASRRRAQAPLTPAEVFVEPLPQRRDPSLPASLVDLSVKPPPLYTILCGAGRPPCDALCLLRAFLAAPPDAKVEACKKPKQRKVPRMRKRCGCGKDNWETCTHAWVPTDQGAAVVVKGPTRVFWAHKTSVAAFADSEIPFDARVCLYGAESDSNTLVPHLELLERDLPRVISELTFALADDGYQGNHQAVARFGNRARLIVPVHPRKARAGLADAFDGIDHFTALGFPICQGGHRFVLRGRDIIDARYIWAAPDDEAGRPVCAGCLSAQGCLKRGQRRYIRVDHKDQPQLDWDHPQLLVRDRTRYQKRTGVERAIKRLKVDLNAEQLTHRDVHRVQAHLDRKLLTLHVLLEVAASP